MKDLFTKEHVETFIKDNVVRVLTQPSNYENHIAVRESEMIDVLGNELGNKKKRLKFLAERYAATDESAYKARIKVTWGVKGKDYSNAL